MYGAKQSTQSKLTYMNIIAINPQLSFRQRSIQPELIVLHATAGSTARSSIDHLRSVGLSYHYIIARDGKDSSKSSNAENTTPIIFHCVPNEGHAFHVSSKIPSPGGQGINKSSIGISLANIQRKTNPEPYPVLQIQALNELLAHLKTTVPSLKFLSVHAVLQPWNRTDPLHINGQQLAIDHGFQFFLPTASQVAAHRPPKQKIR